MRKQAEATAEARARQAEEAQPLLQALHDEAERVRRRLERILAGIKDDFVMYDHDWRYVYINERAAQTLGYPKEQLVGQRIWDLFPEAVGNDFYQKVHQAVAENREIRFEFYYEPFDKWFENRAYPIADGLLLFSADITERKRVEEKLRQSEERMRLAIEANRMVAWDWDSVTDRVNTSQNVADIYGVSAVTEAAEGFAMIWPEDLPAHQEKVARITREGGEYQSQFRITRPVDGRTVWIEERASARLCLSTGPGGRCSA
jgi:PAS domain S-box-containing protein